MIYEKRFQNCLVQLVFVHSENLEGTGWWRLLAQIQNVNHIQSSTVEKMLWKYFSGFLEMTEVINLHIIIIL